MENTRSKRSIKNMVFSTVYFLVDLFLKFLVRTIFIKVLTVDLLGLNGLFSNILQVLSLAELGIGTALTFSMYKPMAEDNKEKVVALYKYYKKIYTIIIAIIVIIGVVLIPFLRFLINGEMPTSVNLYIVYLLYIANTALSYMSAHKKSLLMAAQRQDLNSKAEIVKTLFLNIFQVAVLLLFKNYYVYITFLPLSTIIEYLIVSRIAVKKFPDICKSKLNAEVDTETKKEIKNNTVALIFHKIGGTIVFSTDNILISSLLGLTILGIYSNYYLIVSSLILLVNVILNALKGSIGNLIAKESRENIVKTFNKMNFIYMWLAGFMAVCLGCLFQPFIKFWLDENLMFSDFTMLLLVVSFYLNISKFMVYSFKECAGLLSQDKYRPILEVVVNLVLSIVLAKFIGVNGIIVGTIVSMVVGPIITEPYVVYKHLFKENVFKYYIRYICNLIVTALIFALCFYLCNLVVGYGILQLGLKLIICVVVFNFAYLLLTFWTKNFKESVKWGIQILKKNKNIDIIKK